MISVKVAPVRVILVRVTSVRVILVGVTPVRVILVGVILVKVIPLSDTSEGDTSEKAISEQQSDVGHTQRE